MVSSAKECVESDFGWKSPVGVSLDTLALFFARGKMEPKHIHLIDTLIDRQTTTHEKESVSMAGFSKSLRNPLYLFCHVDIVRSKRFQSLLHQTNRPFLSKTTQGLVKRE